MSIGFWQVVVIALVVVAIFSAGRINRFFRELGKGVKSFKEEIDSVKPEASRVVSLDSARTPTQKASVAKAKPVAKKATKKAPAAAKKTVKAAVKPAAKAAAKAAAKPATKAKAAAKGSVKKPAKPAAKPAAKKVVKKTAAKTAAKKK